MKFISKEYLLYYLQATFVGVFLLVLLAYNVDTTEKNFINNGMYSENVSGVQIENPKEMQGVDQETSLDVKSMETKNGFMLYKYLIESGNEIVRAVYGTDDVFKLSSYIGDGRFFNESENCYLGYERKRGALLQFNELLLGKMDTSEIRENFFVNTIKKNRK